jgi:hypothetical protein
VTSRPERPIDHSASTDVLAAVVGVEIAALLRRAPSKDEALLALAARRELGDRMRRHRWLALEAARTTGAAWAEIAAAAGMGPSDHHIGGQPDKQHERDGHRHILLWAAPEQERSSLRPERQTTLVLGVREPSVQPLESLPVTNTFVRGLRR